MTWNEYLPLAEKTLSSQFHCEEKEQRLLHAIIGSLTEVEELLDNYKDGVLITDTNKQGGLSEEVADIAWYLSILFREYNINIEEFPLDENEKSPYDLLIFFTKDLLKMLDFLKKKLYYNKPMDDMLMMEITIRVYGSIIWYCRAYDVDFYKSLDKNIDKLKARYGSAFSSDSAINRDLEKEKKILEK